MLTVRCITPDGVTPIDRTALPDTINAPPGVVWVELVAPTPDEQAVLSELALHPLAVEDLLDQHHQPRLDEFRNYLLLTVHEADLDEAGFELSTKELDVVLGKGWLLTYADEPLDALRAVADRVERNPELAGTAPRLLYELLDTMVDVYLPFLELIDGRIDELEEELFDRPEPVVRDEIYLLRRDAITLRRITVPQAEAVRRLATRAEDGRLVTTAEARYFRDVHDQLVRIADLVDSYRELLDSALDQYQASVANAQNEVMKVLTMVSAVLLPITVVAGIYGMNFRFMPELDERWGYPAVMTFNAAIVVVAVAFFRWRGWIGGRRRRRRAEHRMHVPAVGRVIRIPAIGKRAPGRPDDGAASVRPTDRRRLAGRTETG